MSKTLKKRLRRSKLSFYQPSILNLLLQKGLHRRNKFEEESTPSEDQSLPTSSDQLINQWPLHLRHGSKYSYLLLRGNSVFIFIFCIFRLACLFPYTCIEKEHKKIFCFCILYGPMYSVPWRHKKINKLYSHVFAFSIPFAYKNSQKYVGT
jgi:hypothetical protein